MTAAATVPDLQAECSKLRRELDALRRERDDAERRAEAPPELRGHKTWGVTELLRVLADANTTGKLLPTDKLVLMTLYSMAIWPAEAAPPEATDTPPISYDFLAAKVGLGRSGIEKAVGRLRERGWVETTRDPPTGYLVYTLEIGRMLDELAEWGTWTTQDAKASRPPSRRSTVPRSERWQGRSPTLPASPRSKPRSPEAARLIRQWRRTWQRTADPTAMINRLLGEGFGEKEIRRAMLSMENLARPRPEYLQDRVERASYRRPEPASDPDPAPSPEPRNGADVDQGSDGSEPDGEAGRPRNGGAVEPASEPPHVAPGSPEVAPRGLAVLPPDPVDERPPEAERERMSARLGAWLASQPSSSRSRSRKPALSAESADVGAGHGLEGTACTGRSPPGLTGDALAGQLSTGNRNENWTESTGDDNTAAGHVPERVRATIPRTSDPPTGEG